MNRRPGLLGKTRKQKKEGNNVFSLLPTIPENIKIMGPSSVNFYPKVNFIFKKIVL